MKIAKGYTLIELIIVLGVLALGVGAITMFLTSLLKGTNKANVTAEVKQNGQAVLDSLERQIRGAVSVAEVGTGNDHIKLFRQFSEPLHVKCEGETATHNSRIVIAVAPDSGVPDENEVIPADWRSVSNDDPIEGINVKNCRLEVFSSNASQLSGSPPTVVSIKFLATKKSERADFVASSEFQTTISLRQY